MYWYFRWCSLIRRGICFSDFFTKPLFSISNCSWALDLTVAPLSASTYPPSQLERFVNCSSHEKGVTMTTTPPLFITACRPSKQASGSGRRHKRFASTAPSKVPNSAASSFSLHASPTLKVILSRTSAVTFGSCTACSSALKSPSSRILNLTASPRFILSADLMKDSLKSMPITSSNPALASANEDPPTAQPRSKALPLVRVGSASTKSCATRCGKPSACVGAPSWGRIAGTSSLLPDDGKCNDMYWLRRSSVS
mmetsp:Transcript_33370/g.76166  ORF Transcript_33370/g.76166 Transcript_33370/m.76166 type:complete len:254 (-) Transcript_33370:2045-2806(-)